MNTRAVTLDGLAVADVMTIDPVVVRASATLEQAIGLFRSYSITGLPVVDDRGVLVGLISQTDLVAVTGPSAIGRLVRAQPDRLRVAELMTSPAITVPMTESIREAARLMVNNGVHRLVAVDEAGSPVGVLSAFDFVVLVAEG